MKTIIVNGKSVTIFFDSFADFKACADEEYERLNNSPRVGINGKPTNDTSLFASRQQIMYHVTHMIEAFMKSQDILTLENFYYHTELAHLGCVVQYTRAHGMATYYLSEFDKMIEDVKKKFDEFENTVFSDSPEGVIKRIKAQGIISDMISELYDFLIDAKGEMNCSNERFIYSKCTHLVLMFCEVGMSFFDDAELFDFSFLKEIETLKNGIHNRHRQLKELRARLEKMNI